MKNDEIFGHCPIKKIIAAFKYSSNKIDNGDQMSSPNYVLPNQVLTFDDKKFIFAYRILNLNIIIKEIKKMNSVNVEQI